MKAVAVMNIANIGESWRNENMKKSSK